ncbi:MAG TPA: 16S rRNA (cytidine(1402)-2'-O)-methyltransferase [Pyrinomonadaceae bacterium]|jgi:16S rRNA (cytidine1402-2'-O)-methyltransferase|nr:16S rRNA (cytidine(1402)-2'-O)-methyltransferase [Pyrinomonadaceae bacterium]
MLGTLYLVATPIGNLQDITLRALEILRTVDVIACEDTRHTQKLLTHFGVQNRTTSYHEHNEHERAPQLVARMLKGESIAVVSDAGTPGICDPGFRIVGLAIEAGIDVVPVPGPAAFVAAATASGLATDSIYFGGFLPSRKNERRKRLEECALIPGTIVFYETPHRLANSLADCAEVLGDRPAGIARELTKLHEEIARGTLSQLAQRFVNKTVKGEIVLVIDRGAGVVVVDSEMTLEQRVAQIEAEGLDKKAALKQAAKEFGLSKSEAYRLTQVKR